MPENVAPFLEFKQNFSASIRQSYAWLILRCFQDHRQKLNDLADRVERLERRLDQQNDTTLAADAEPAAGPGAPVPDRSQE